MTDGIEGLPLDRQPAIAERRRRQLQPSLASLSAKAIEAYEKLRPLADHVSEVDMDAALRHQQVHGPSNGGLAADYLMVGFGDHHGITLYRNYDRRPDWDYDWRLDRVMPVGAKQTEETRVTAILHPEEQYTIRVSSYAYAQEIGHNAMLDDYLCSAYDNFHSAETYILEFEADIDRAMRELG